MNSTAPLRVLVVGAGGLGSYLAASLAVAGHEVTALARGDHAAAMKARGLTVVEGVDSKGRLVESNQRFRCVDGFDEAGPQDVALVTVKSFSLDKVAPGLARLSKEGTTVVPFLNGVDAAERLVLAGVKRSQVLPGVAYLTAFRTAPGRVERNGDYARLLIGATGEVARSRVEPVVAAFEGTGVQAAASHDIRRELWLKMAVVCTLSALCGTSGSPLGPVRGHPSGRALQRRAVREVLAVADASRVNLRGDADRAVNGILDGFPDDFYPSVLHDLRAGRPTEIDALSGTIARLGAEYEVDTPLHAFAAWVIEVRSVHVQGSPARPT